MKKNKSAISKLKKIIAGLKAENEALKTIIDKTPASVVITDPDGNIEFVNPYFSRHTGYSLEESRGKNPRVLKSGCHHGKVYEDLWAAITSGKVWEGELCNKKKNGELYWEQANIAPIQNGQGKIVHYVAIKFDITESKKALQELEEAKKFNDILIDNANVMIVGINNDGNVMLFNKAAERISGFSCRETLGENWFDKLITPEMSAGPQRTIKELIINNGIPPVYEYSLFTKSGNKKVISWQNTTLIGNNSQMMHISFGIDITGQKESEIKLQESEARFKKLIQNSGDVFAIVDRNLNIKFISNSVERMTGYSTAESIGTNIFDIIHPEDITKIRELIVNGADIPNFTKTIVYRRKRRDGSYIYVESVVQNLYHDDLIQGVLINSRDVTERRQHELKLKELNATKDKLFSIIAHDLRGPIGNSALLLEMMANEQIDFEPEEKSAMLKEHSGALKNTGRLLENLLDWARSQKNDVRIEKKTIDLNRLIEECFDILKMQTREKNITLTYHNPHQASIFADERMMKTVIRNLVSNALKFSYENGAVRVIVENETGGVRICVCDEGVGMSADKIERLFKITDNITTSGTRGENGTGLGLILCHEFIEKNGGTIKVKSEPQKGSSFIMSFPSVQAAVNDNGTEKGKSEPQNSKFAEPLNILIAEDDISTQHLIEKIFKIRGWKPRFANNGLEAIESYRKAKTDIILMDINMPLMNGIAAMNEIRKIENGSGARTPIIAFTTFNSHEEIESYLKCGFDDYAPKPVHVNALFEKIESNILKKLCSTRYCLQYLQERDTDKI